MDSDTIILAFIFFAHLFFFTWAILVFMANSSYVPYNIIFLVSLLWSIHSRNRSSPLFVALMLNVMSIVMDAILIGILYKDAENEHRYIIHGRFIFSVIATFINLFFRLVSSALLFVIYRKRRDTDDDAHHNVQDVMQTVRQYFNSVSSAPQPPPRTTTTVHVTVP